MVFFENFWWLLVLIGVMIIVHELGHYWAARLFDIRVDTFSVGFGPRLFGFKKGETDFRVAWIPFGGYVRMAGEQVSDEMDPRGFLSKPRWQRLIVVIAGPAMNMILAVALLAGLFMVRYPKLASADGPAAMLAPAWEDYSPQQAVSGNVSTWHDAAGGRFVPDIFSSGSGHGSARKGYGPALIDDDTPTPEHARYRRGRVAGYAFAGLAIWLASMLALVEFSGWTGTLSQIGWFFTKAALLTFGGAYAVLPYVYQGAVEQYQWLSAAQMIDGLALGETTPGPLIMVVAFVGFVGGWTKALFGPESLFLAGAAAASVATFFTFLPSFVFILVGGPLVESTHGDLKFTAPLTGITAAVVGVIVSLALFFAKHVFWPQVFTGAPDWVSMALAAASLAALLRFKAGLIPLILAMGGAGLLLRLSGLA